MCIFYILDEAYGKSQKAVLVPTSNDYTPLPTELGRYELRFIWNPPPNLRVSLMKHGCCLLNIVRFFSPRHYQRNYYRAGAAHVFNPSTDAKAGRFL